MKKLPKWLELILRGMTAIAFSPIYAVGWVYEAIYLWVKGRR